MANCDNQLKPCQNKYSNRVVGAPSWNLWPRVGGYYIHTATQETVFTASVSQSHTHTYTQCSDFPPGDNKHLIKQFRCTSAEVDYMYLAQKINSGSHVHCNYTQHLCLAHLQSLLWMPSSNLTIIISTGEKGNIEQAVQLNYFTIKNAAVFSSREEEHCLNRIPGIMNHQKPSGWNM